MMKYFRSTLLVCSGLLLTALAGCASTFNSTVTTFQSWPIDATTATYTFADAPGTSKSLEQQTYEGYVRNELANFGLREAATGEAARLQVAVTTEGQEETRQYVEPVYSNPPPPIFIPGYYRYGPHGAYWVGGYWASPYWGPTYLGDRTVTQRYLRATLRVLITDGNSRDAHGNARAIFDSTASAMAPSGSLPRVAPLLARAAMSGFPGQNGTVRTVRIDPETGRVMK